MTAETANKTGELLVKLAKQKQRKSWVLVTCLMHRPMNRVVEFGLKQNILAQVDILSPEWITVFGTLLENRASK